MTFDEIDFETATWRVPKERMKMQKEHHVPLSAAALAILKAQHETRGKIRTCFRGGQRNRCRRCR
jgi:integrase